MLTAKLRREILVGLSKMGLKKAKVHRDNVSFQIPLIHGMGRFLFVTHEPWRKKTLRAVACMDPEVVLDVGVNVGQTLLDVKEVLPNVDYYGFEPNPSCVFYTSEMISMNGFVNTMVLPFGLGEVEEVKVLYSNHRDDASSSLNSRDSNIKKHVYIRNGDSFIESQKLKNVSLIKIDTEGFEFQVLKGLSKTIAKDRPVIFCEIFNEKKDENKKIESFFQKLDYIRFEQSQKVELKKSNTNEFTNPCQDYIFAPQEKSKAFENHFQ